MLLYALVSFLWDLLFQEKSIFERTKLSVFRFARKIPFVKSIIKGKLKEPLTVIFSRFLISNGIEDIEKSMFKHAPKTKFAALPAKPMAADKLVSLLADDYQSCGDPAGRHKSGKVISIPFVSILSADALRITGSLFFFQ
jgi:hypothetical protein